MATKHNCSCLEKAADDEPIFVLRAQDVLASKVVDYWASLAQARGVEQEKLKEARVCAEQMRAWPNRKLPD